MLEHLLLLFGACLPPCLIYCHFVSCADSMILFEFCTITSEMEKRTSDREEGL